ncbi:hypothetical protein TNCV_1610501 [Trichonephila clavipes]|nr:hypothetical protein TNCV_1610501 [Trichonephila clavipes]
MTAMGCPAHRETQGLRYPSGQGIGSWQTRHEFEPSTIKDPPWSQRTPLAGISSNFNLKQFYQRTGKKLFEAVAMATGQTSFQIVARKKNCCVKRLYLYPTSESASGIRSERAAFWWRTEESIIFNKVIK